MQLRIALIGGGYAYCAFDLIYSFHMPLFFFISGYCSQKVFTLISWKEKINYIRTRFLRLMVPYFTIALIYIPLNVWLAEFKSAPDEGNVWINILKGDNPDYQLWTLYALFLMAVLITVFNRIPISGIVVIAGICFIGNELIGTDIDIIDRFCREFIFFVLGITIHRKGFVINEKKWKLTISVAVCFGVGYILRSIVVAEASKTDFLFLVTGCSGIYLTVVAAKLIANKKCMVNKFLNLVGTYSMDIYIMGNLPQVAARVLCFTLLSLPGLAGCAMSIAMGILLPIAASKLVIRRFKPLQGLVLGVWKK